ncbi:MAG TPA: energy transducer TonB [Smithella sp.]|nr:energy transducer TonB [Smithella sp.]
MTPRTLSNSYRGNNSNIYSMIFLSLIIHLIVITILLISIPTASRHLTFGTAYSVSLVGSEAVRSANDSSGFNDMLQTNEATRSIIIKRKITSIYSTPVKNQETHKLNIEKAVSAIRNKGLNQSKATRVSSAFDKPALSNAEINAQTNEYLGVVESRIKGNWMNPQALMPEKNITIIDIRIARSGALEYANFEKRSGNRYFDDSALRAVKKSSPFPPLPYWVMDNSIELGVRFP